MRIRRKFDLYQHLPLFAKHDYIICAKCDDKLLLHRMPAKFQVAKRVKDRADEEEKVIMEALWKHCSSIVKHCRGIIKHCRDIVRAF